MSSCKKASVIERILLGDSSDSITKLVSYANQINGMKKLYDEGNLNISKNDYKLVKAAYDHIMLRLNGGGIGLNYIPPKKEVIMHERRRERYKTRS